ncbi:MAG TPA: radical SAM protein, partial [Reyranellaceae bacterium]|nr:radical SAM protein [Reyranellaceae bacterium]
MSSQKPKTFRLVLIKPSHYDDEGYPITWLRSFIPSNTLAALNGIAEDCQRRRVMGPDVDIVLETYDETNRRIVPRRIIREIARSGEKALICFVGVQSNQFPRAVDLAQPFLKAGLPVAMGGFHVAGCLSMLKEVPPEIKAAMDQGISMFAGEAEEGRLDEVLLDAWNGRLKPLYRYIEDFPGLEGQPTPTLPAAQIQRNIGHWSSFDLGRGCPFQCSFCTIINVQGRKSRFRTAEDLEQIVRDNRAQGIDAFFITDDNMARNRHWEAFFDKLIELREKEGIAVDLVIQVDTQCHKIPNFIHKARMAGVSRVFIGLENINPDNLMAAKKRQNKITDYRVMIQQWHKSGAYTWAGYITGFPADTKESLLRDIEIIKRELPLDILEFFFLTPLPGSEDHQTLHNKGIWMDPDLNKYDLNHRVSHHPKMSDKEWEEAYEACWKSYYTLDHIETVARRHAALPEDTPGKLPGKAVQFMMEFKTLYEAEDIHPLEGGMLRLKFRTDRRPGRPRELPVLFHLRLLGQLA